MGCSFRARLNQLSSIWYTVLVVLLQVYLLYLGFERYKLYNEMKWPTGGYPHVWLTVYVFLYAACIPACLFFFSFGFFKSGNIAGDNERLADREERVIEISRNRKGEKTGCFHRMKTLWQHSPPMPQQIHVIMALCQLLAQQLVLSQLYRQSFINSSEFLNTEMDFLYQRARQLAINLPIGETRLQGFQMTSDDLSRSPLAPNILPVLMHARLFGIPLEFVNLFIALVAYSIAYPSVFWRVSKPFGIIFSVHLLIYAASTIWGYLAFSIIFRIQETNYNTARPVGLGQYLAHSRQLPFYHPFAILGTYVATFVLTTLAPLALYTYGYNKYFVNLMQIQAKNMIRTGSSGQSEYSEMTRRSHIRNPTSQLCCDGYGPHTVAIILLVLIVIAKAPTIYALLILYQHEEKPILLTCIIIDVVYIFTWILLWLMLTLKREWDFNVVHKAHQLYALQKGMASGQIRGNENPSQLKNALIVMHRDHMFVTDEQAAKQTLLRHIQKGNDSTDESYWMKVGAQAGAPSTRKIPMDESVRNTPEVARLIRQPVDDNPHTVSYHQITSSGRTIVPVKPEIMGRGNSSPPDDRSHNTFGTLQRNQQSQGYSGMMMQRTAASGTLQRSMPTAQWPTQQEAYASIHKANNKDMSMYQRRGSNDGGHYGQIENNYSTYGTYTRLPPQQSRIAPQVTAQVGTMRVNGTNYGLLNTNQRRPQDATVGSVRQSPLLGDRGGSGTTLNTSVREQSPYQRTALKLSSFNASDKGGVYASGNEWGSQRVPPGQPNQLLLSQNKQQSLSTSSSQQDAQCFTPTSTLTSQTGSNYSSQHTATPNSPQATTPLYARANGGSGIYGHIGDDTYGDRTLQKKPVGGTLRTPIKPATRNDDSANFSIASSNGSTETARVNNDFATSIV